MLEIIAIGYLFIKMGNMLRARGWNRTIWMQLAVIVTWIASLVIGGLTIGIANAIINGPDAALPSAFFTYLMILPFELASLGILFYGISRIPIVPLPPQLPEDQPPKDTLPSPSPYRDIY